MALGLDDIDKKLKFGVDKLFGAIGKTTSILVSSLFLLFSLGAVYGFFIAHSPHKVILLTIPPALGIFAYYSRGFAVFIALVLLVILAF